MVLVRFWEVNIEFLEEMIERKVGGLLILFPEDMIVDIKSRERWINFERLFLEKRMSLSIPVYFAIENSDLRDYYSQIETVSSSMDVTNSADAFQLVSSSTEPSSLQNVVYTNFQGWMNGLREINASMTQPIPTIAVVAYYDSFAFAPV